MKKLASRIEKLVFCTYRIVFWYKSFISFEGYKLILLLNGFAWETLKIIILSEIHGQSCIITQTILLTLVLIKNNYIS